MTGGARGAVLAPLLVAVLLLPACARIPSEGPLVEGSAPELTEAAVPFDFSPPGPEAGATPEQVVTGFLTALQATPLTTTVAREFLTEQAADGWHPERRTLLYGEQHVLSPPAASGRAPVTVPVSLRRVFALDRTGRWQGPQRRVERAGFRLSLVKEAGEWRLADPPDALVLPLAHFENRYRRFAIHFADPTGRLLVPEPVYQPLEVQTPTQLINALLAGPRGDGQGAGRSFLPPRTELVVSVPVGDDGVARVPLTADILDLAPRDLVVAAAQVAWTLRQVPEVRAVRLTADGEPVSVPGVGELVPVDAFPGFSPVVASASTDLYGLRRGEVRRVSPGGEESTVVRLPAGVRATGLGVGLRGGPVAVGDPGGMVHVLARSSGRRDPVAPVATLRTGPVVRPFWDWSDALWLVPRRFGGEVRVVVRDRPRSLRWDVPWAIGQEVRAAALSRDGSRLVLALDRRGGGSSLLLARVLRSSGARGGPVALRPVGVIGTAEPLEAVVDIGWRDPLTLAVLTRVDRLSSRVLSVPVDGQQQSGALSDDSDVLFGRAVAMTASPATEEVRVTTSDGDVQLLTSTGGWRLEQADRPPLRAPTYVG